MWWLLIPVIALVGKAILDEDKAPPVARKKTTLESNLDRLKKNLESNSGLKIAIVGQPGSGKSSLLKKMTNGKVKPLPVIGNQTDATDWSSDSACNLLSIYENYTFADVPGYDTSSHPINSFSSLFPFNHFDFFIFVINGKLHSSDEEMFRLIIKHGKRLTIAKSFSESLDSTDITSVENDIRMRLLLSDSVPIIFFSNRTGNGIESVFNSIRH